MTGRQCILPSLVLAAFIVASGVGTPMTAQAQSLGPRDDERSGDRCGSCGRHPIYGSVMDRRRQGGDSHPTPPEARITRGTPAWGAGGRRVFGVRGPGSSVDEPAPPPPPTPDEALAACPVPAAPAIGRDPDPEGITGLETYLWAEPHTGESTRTEVRGYAVECALTPVQWTWETGDGATYTRSQPGGPHPDHAAEHVYETKGDYTMTLTVTWEAVTTYGSASLTRSAHADYHVFEVRSVRTG